MNDLNNKKKEVKMTNALAKQGVVKFTDEQTALIKRTVAVGASDDELELFLYQAKRTGLDPLCRQIYCIVRSTKNHKTGAYDKKATFQTGIDGYRLIAERTGMYMPGADATFEYDEAGVLISATATILKFRGEKEYPVVATARFNEYAQTRDKKPTYNWEKMPHIMLAKCAEALAIRKAFPDQLAGVYTDEEMGQADNINDPVIDIVEESKEKAENYDAGSMLGDLIKWNENEAFAGISPEVTEKLAKFLGSMKLPGDWKDKGIHELVELSGKTPVEIEKWHTRCIEFAKENNIDLNGGK